MTQKDDLRLYVKDGLEAIELIKVLQIQGFTECYLKDPITNKEVRIEIEQLRTLHLAIRQP
jgi:hypothetical protein